MPPTTPRHRAQALNKPGGESARNGVKEPGGKSAMRRTSQGVNQPEDERAKGRTSQGANWQRGKKARHQSLYMYLLLTVYRAF